MFEVGDFVRVKYMAGGLEEFVDAEIDEISKNGKEFKVLFDEFDDEDSFSWEPARALQKRSKGLFEKSRRRASGSARTAFRNPTDTNFGAKTVEELTAPKQQKPAFPFALPSFGSNEPAEEEFFQEEPEPEKKPAFAFPSFNFGSNAPAEEPPEEEEEPEPENKPAFAFPSFSFGSNAPAEEPPEEEEEPEPEKKPAFAFPSFNFGSNAPAEEPLEEEEEEPLEEEEETKPGFSFPSFPKF
jgi:hypothetical protein